MYYMEYGHEIELSGRDSQTGLVGLLTSFYSR